MHQTPDISNLKKDSHYFIQLDGLRFFAILFVMIAHWLQWQTNKAIYKGFPFTEGVTLFFVLSGYLITDILLRNRLKSDELNISKLLLVKAFYIRRALRIFPVYFITILFLLAISYKNILSVFPWLITFSSNIYMPLKSQYMGNFNHFWSLAVEEQFYLFWPWLIVFIPSKHIEKSILLIIIVSVVSKHLFYSYTGNWMAVSYYTICCMNALGLGALLAYWSIFKQDRVSFLLNPFLVLLSIVSYFTIHYLAFFKEWEWEKNVLDSFLFALMCVLFLNYAAQNKFKSVFKYILENKFVVYSGKISYAMYLFHLFIPDFYKEYLYPKMGLDITNKFLSFLIYYTTAFILAHISWQLIEKPFNNLKKYFPYAKSIKTF